MTFHCEFLIVQPLLAGRAEPPGTNRLRPVAEPSKGLKLPAFGEV